MIYTSRCGRCNRQMTLVNGQWVTDAGTEQETWRCGIAHHQQAVERGEEDF
jgi:hypothetical protein